MYVIQAFEFYNYRSFSDPAREIFTQATVRIFYVKSSHDSHCIRKIRLHCIRGLHKILSTDTTRIKGARAELRSARQHRKPGRFPWTRARRAVGAPSQRTGHHRRTSHGRPPCRDSARIFCRNSECHTCTRCRVVKSDVPGSARHGRPALASAGD